MLSQTLLIIGTTILAILGCAHLYYTFCTDKFNAYAPEVTKAMKSTSPVITKDTTVWRAWIGFNASHSIGLLTFACIYLPLSWLHMSFLKANIWLMILPVFISCIYLWLAKRYWFKVPLLGMLFATICFVTAYISSI